MLFRCLDLTGRFVVDAVVGCCYSATFNIRESNINYKTSGHGKTTKKIQVKPKPVSTSLTEDDKDGCGGYRR